MRQLTARSALFLLGLVALVRAADEPPVPLNYDRLDLTDGRQLRKVVIKSYDAAADKFVLIADGKFTTLPAALVAGPLGSKLKAAAPVAGASTSSTPSRKVYAPVVVTGPDNTPHIYRPAVLTPQEELKVHQSIALRQATLYYKYQYPLAPNTAKVLPDNFELEESQPVKGWIGRYSTKGKVQLTFIDSHGAKSDPVVSRFEVVTEKDSGRDPRILNFIVQPSGT